MAKAKDYQTLSQEFDALLARLQHPEVQVDEAVKLYEQGLQLVAQLEDRLQLAENKIEQLRLAATQPSS